MSDRERWILYPLLFFSLSLGIKTKWDAANGQSTFQRVVCRELVVQTPFEKPRFVLGESMVGGGILELFDSDGKRAVTLQSGDGGGAILLVRKKDQKVLVLGHDSDVRLSGIMAYDQNNDGRLIPIDSRLIPSSGWQLLRWPAAKPETKKKSSTEEKKPPPADSEPEQ